MIFVDFGVVASSGFKEPVAINWRCAHIAEAVRMELARRQRIHAPFAKLVFELSNTEAAVSTPPTMLDLDGIGIVGASAAESVLLGEYEAFRQHLHTSLLTALDGIPEESSWDPASLVAILGDIAEREIIFHYHLETLSKRDRRTGRRVDVYHDMTEHETTLRAVITDRDGTFLREEVVAADSQPLPLVLFFPVVSTILQDGDLIFRDRRKEPIAIVNVSDSFGTTAEVSARRRTESSDSR